MRPFQPSFSLSSKGFTLVELLVTVGIIGILAAISIPNYTKFMARGRQSEAKLALSAIYTAEKAYSVEFYSFSACLLNIGYTPTSGGARFYEVGFSNAASVATTCTATGTASCTTYGGTSACSANTIAGADTTLSGATSYGASVVANPTKGFPKDADFPSNGLSLAHFSAGAAGNISNSATQFDKWVIDDNKTLSNPTSGL